MFQCPRCGRIRGCADDLYEAVAGSDASFNALGAGVHPCEISRCPSQRRKVRDRFQCPRCGRASVREQPGLNAAGRLDRSFQCPSVRAVHPCGEATYSGLPPEDEFACSGQCPRCGRCHLRCGMRSARSTGAAVDADVLHALGGGRQRCRARAGWIRSWITFWPNHVSMPSVRAGVHRRAWLRDILPSARPAATATFQCPRCGRASGCAQEPAHLIAA